MKDSQDSAATGSSGRSRRAFLATAGAGAAVAGVAVAGPSFAGSGPALSHGNLLVTVVDAEKGVFAVMVDEREVLVTDKAFASKLAAAIR